MLKIHGGEILARMLKMEGVDKVFGIIDGTYFGFYSNLKKYDIDIVTPRHETSALHMAGAYARLTGRIGVAMASNGPGVANALPGVAVENGEGNRVLLITSCRRTGIAYPDRGGTYQYFDQVGVIGPMSKWSASAQSFDRIPELMRQALRKCWQGRPGVVHIDVPENLMNQKTEIAEAAFLPPKRYRRVDPVAPSDEQVADAAQMLKEASLPMIHAGTGVIHAGAYDELAEVAELLRCPVTTTWSARGATNEDSDLAIPMVLIETNGKVRNAADLVLAIGTRIGETDFWGKPPYWRSAREQKMIQVDIDEEFIGRNKPCDLGVVADAKVFLKKLAAKLKKMKIDTAPREKAVAEFKKLCQKDRAKLDEALKDKGEPMNTAHVATVCREFFQEDAVAVFDGGNTTVWANFYHHMTVPNTQIFTHKFGMLGAGVAQALGAAVARPSTPVYCIIGDGAMGFHPQEIETAIRNNLKVIYLVCCDRQWGMVKMNQQFMLKPLKTMVKKSLSADETINTDLGEIDFNTLAKAMGAHGERVYRAEELKPALERCVEADRCAVIHVDVDPVKHMWAPGLMHFKDMHLEPKGE